MLEKPKALKEKSLQAGNALIKDLAPEEKEKIGELMRRLAHEKALREEFQAKYEQLQGQYDELAARYQREVTRKDQQNRFIKLQLKNSLRKLEQSTEHLKYRKSAPKTPPLDTNLQKLHEVESQPTIKLSDAKDKLSPLKSSGRSGSKRQEIEQLKKQIETLSKGLKSIPTPSSQSADLSMTANTPSPLKKLPQERATEDPKAQAQRLRQYELIKSRYAANVSNMSLAVDDSFRAAPEEPDTPTLPDPMTFLKTEPERPQPIIQTSSFLQHPKEASKSSLIDYYQTQRVGNTRYNNQNPSIVQTVKKGPQNRPVYSNPRSSVAQSGFYGSQLLDLVEFLEK